MIITLITMTTGQECGTVAQDYNSQICTGHISKGPTEYVFQVSVEYVDVVQRDENPEPTWKVTRERRAVFEVVDYVKGLQRPLVKAPDTNGRMRLVTSCVVVVMPVD